MGARSHERVWSVDHWVRAHQLLREPMTLPPLPITMVGSWPRRKELLRAQKAKRRGKLSAEEFERVADEEVRRVLALQSEAGVDIVTDGEQRRDSFFSFVAEKLEGVAMMTLAEMLDIIEDKAGFEMILQTLDVPAFSISNATCVGEVKRRAPLAVDELKFLKQHTDKPVKVPLPGPYLLTRGMFVREVSQPHYETKEALGDAVVTLLREEVRELLDAGADFIQFDEPVLTEVVFTQGQARTFNVRAPRRHRRPHRGARVCGEPRQSRARGHRSRQRAHRPSHLPGQLEPGRVHASSGEATIRLLPT